MLFKWWNFYCSNWRSFQSPKMPLQAANPSSDDDDGDDNDEVLKISDFRTLFGL